jgi:hypothetical protein
MKRIVVLRDTPSTRNRRSDRTRLLEQVDRALHSSGWP